MPTFSKIHSRNQIFRERRNFRIQRRRMMNHFPVVADYWCGKRSRCHIIIIEHARCCAGCRLEIICTAIDGQHLLLLAWVMGWAVLAVVQVLKL